MRKTIEVCSYCGEENCDGIIYETEEIYLIRGSHEKGRFRVCRNARDFVVIAGKPYYKQIFGHGDYEYHLLKKTDL
jgi:hypothetical protein